MLTTIPLTLPQAGLNVGQPQPGYLGSIPGLGRSPGERSGNPLQYSCLENSTDRAAMGLQNTSMEEAEFSEAPVR